MIMSSSCASRNNILSVKINKSFETKYMKVAQQVTDPGALSFLGSFPPARRSGQLCVSHAVLELSQSV